MINRVNYGIQDIPRLPPELATYKAAQKEEENYIAFHGELSPNSNLHRCKFTVNNHTNHSSEQWIQFQKVMLFGDSFTANQILTCSTPYEAKHLGYQINGYDAHRWRQDGYNLCLDGIKEKFLRNLSLLKMLKAATPKKIIKASLDKQWGTGIQL